MSVTDELKKAPKTTVTVNCRLFLIQPYFNLKMDFDANLTRLQGCLISLNSKGLLNQSGMIFFLKISSEYPLNGFACR